MRKPAFKAQVDTFTANAEVVDQLEVSKQARCFRFLRKRTAANDDARYALRAGLGPPRILEAGASLELLEPLEMREGVHSESVLGGR